MLMCLASINYSIGQSITSKDINLFCDIKTQDEVLEHIAVNSIYHKVIVMIAAGESINTILMILHISLMQQYGHTISKIKQMYQ